MQGNLLTPSYTQDNTIADSSIQRNNITIWIPNSNSKHPFQQQFNLTKLVLKSSLCSFTHGTSGRWYSADWFRKVQWWWLSPEEVSPLFWRRMWASESRWFKTQLLVGPVQARPDGSTRPDGSVWPEGTSVTKCFSAKLCPNPPRSVVH